ncbi:Transducin family protein / WD-40 repeat family protein [Striga hermonthica]|uniref:Transducin family protein / WD-40 repeat family protein n=1 Tax=Striga hermonthica TaxID=68872 RepID=A0A9N7NAV7_STRHE|nr:Transducin family protein / WD-40 repeat family protein [Striga hermonthica]
MSTTEQSQWQLHRGQYLGEISALCFLHLPPHASSLPLLLAGTGSQILVYDLKSGDILRSFQVFEGIRVHGISLGNSHKHFPCTCPVFLVAVYGERKVKLFTLKVESDRPTLDMELTLMHSLPKFGHWVMDACFLKDGTTASEGARYLAVGCSDNSLYFWNILGASMFSEVKSAEKCLLYSMSMLGNEIESLRIASGTIFNEIVVWKVVQNHAIIHEEDHARLPSDGDSLHLDSKYKDALISRLVGHEGSIFRIAWFSNGLKLISVSDDRSARIWEVEAENKVSCKSLPGCVNHLVGPVLFGHNARVWDCCIFDSLIITAGEDCTCRVWDHDGRELNEIKEHIGRGVWRCLYDPSSSLLVTAGFDSAIKVHQFHASFKGLEGNVEQDDFSNSKEVFAISLPNLSEHDGPMDSKSEYVRCLRFTSEDSLYVATNNGYLFHASLFTNGSVKWSKLTRVSGESPIICMDILSNCYKPSGGFDDWVAVGDGKGNMTVLLVVRSDGTPKVEYSVTWLAEKERHLLDIYWCKSLDNRFIFTAAPGGRLKFWKLCHNFPPHTLFSKGNGDVYLIAEYSSSFGMRILCVDASFDEELLVCGDIRGNLLLFSLPRGLLCSTLNSSGMNTSPVNYFKGAHGVSSVNSVCISSVSPDQVDIQSSGADGCICYLQHDRDLLNLEFTGMKQVKELSAIRSVFTTTSRSDDFTVSKYAVGFASANFMIWNVTAGTKVVQITCGGWRRPYSYYLGDLPEIMNCFSFVKDDTIYIHRNWVPEVDRHMYRRNIHFQFHGREIHSLCFISGCSLCSSDEDQELDSEESSWVATGCEDGTVRLTRYESGMESWSSSQHLGEHVGGSAVRSICCVSKMHVFVPDSIAIPNLVDRQIGSLEEKDPSILISVGAKRVITAWKQMINMHNKRLVTTCSRSGKKNESDLTDPSTATSSFSFQWLSTDMPFKQTSCVKRQNAKEPFEKDRDLSIKSDAISVEMPSSDYRNMEPNICPENDGNDWRYLDVTAFLVKKTGSRISVCFVIVACSDATVTLRALVLPFRLWFDVALFTPLSSPVLSLQHVVIPKLLPSKGNIQIGNIYFAFTGSTDGSIAIWDLTESVENFMRQTSCLKMESCMEIKKRPRTGRGSQGGRRRLSIGNYNAKNKVSHNISQDITQTVSKSIGRTKLGNEIENDMCETSLSEKSNSRRPFQVADEGSFELGRKKDDLSPETTVLVALQVLDNVHQSGVNCLSVTDIKDLRLSGSSCSFCVVSGGDDQAINCLRFDLQLNHLRTSSQDGTAEVSTNYQNQHFVIQDHQMHFLCLDKIVSAHSSAVKGVWTDGIWVFSVGLDQRVRCWNLGHDRLTEYAHLIINVPEPEALDVKTRGRNYYQIAVAGRGMQMIEFRTSNGMSSVR